jgi:tripartite-type tricarboxylate transporter receptor subunit TctC
MPIAFRPAHLLPLAAALMASATTTALAAWPDKPLTIVVPYPAGGLTDTVTRVLANELSNEIGQTVIVENKPGAGGKIGLDQVKRAAPDGYTLGLAVPATMVTLPLTNPAYDLQPLQDFTPIARAVETFVVLVTRPDLKVSNVGELVAQGKKNELSYGTPGMGTSFHFATEILNQALGIKSLHVPYQGESAVLNDLAGGHLDYMLATNTARPLVEDDRLRALAISTPERHPSFPDVPTFKELNYAVDENGWVGYVGPANMPADLVDAINAALNKALSAPEVQKQFASMGYTVLHDTPADMRAVIEKTSDRYQRLLDAGSVKIAQ